MNSLRCPKCKSNQVVETGEDLMCLKCHCRENLYDYAIHDPAWEIKPQRIEVEREVRTIADTHVCQNCPVKGEVNWLKNKVALLEDKKKVFSYKKRINYIYTNIIGDE